MERKLAAILAVDVVGYSALMETDEAGTFDRLRSSRKELFEPEISKHHGRIFKLMGDGLLAEFGSVVDAVECAVTLQRGMAERNTSVSENKRFTVRIGINLGEVIVEGEDRYGEGVNVAARLQQLAEPGGICVSGKVSREVEKKLAFGFEPMGEQRMKNITEPVACYRVCLQVSSPEHREQPMQAPPRLPDRATIVVLPFTNMSSDPEQEYFVDGLAEDLITDLSTVPGLFVISRHSAFAYKGKSVDIRTIARDLSVRFVVEGSVRRAATQVRINVQLIDAVDNTHLWANRFDRDLADIFRLQDEVVATIVNALGRFLPLARPTPAQRATNIEAYDLFVRGRVLAMQSAQGNIAARPLLERSIELDPDFADAHAWLAMSHLLWITAYWQEAIEPHRSLALAAAQRAVSLDPTNAGAHAILGDVLAFTGEPDAGMAELSRALQINPNHADAWAFSGEVKIYEGSSSESLDLLQKAFRLNPHPPGWYYWFLGIAQYSAGKYEDAVQTLKHESTHRSASQRILAASLAQLGRMEEARAEAAQFLATHPRFSAQHWADLQPFRHEADRKHFIDGYIKAGLPK
jgi:TolB-like protein/Tfp pilus assembly protein PilF